MDIINNELLDAISEQASIDERLRKNYNFHKTLDAPVQRLLNALEPDTVLPIHRHQHTDETYVLLRGQMTVLYYNDKKEVTETVLLDPKTGKYGIVIPAGQWHTIDVHEKGTVIFEVKEGPYKPLDLQDVM